MSVGGEPENESIEIMHRIFLHIVIQERWKESRMLIQRKCRNWKNCKFVQHAKFLMNFNNKQCVWDGPEGWITGNSSHEKFSLPFPWTISTQMFIPIFMSLFLLILLFSMENISLQAKRLFKPETSDFAYLAKAMKDFKKFPQMYSSYCWRQLPSLYVKDI